MVSFRPFEVFRDGCSQLTTKVFATIPGVAGAEIPGITADKAEAMVPRVAKFDVHETDLADANAENLTAFAFQRNSLLMAGRTVDSELAAQAGIEVETVVIPGLGLPVQFRRFYDSDGILYYNCNLLYGVAKGVDYGVRVTSA